MRDDRWSWSSEPARERPSELRRLARIAGVILAGAAVEHVIFAIGRARGLW